MKVVREFTMAFEAELAAGYLQNEGITAEVFNVDSTFPGIGGCSQYYTSRVGVNDEDYDRAVALLEQRDAEVEKELEAEALAAAEEPENQDE